MDIQIKNIFFLGAGKVGGLSISVINDKCHNISANVIDIE